MIYYGINGPDLTYDDYAGCVAAGMHPEFRTEIGCDHTAAPTNAALKLQWAIQPAT